MGHGTCKAANSARHLIESKEKNRSSRVKVFSTHINLSHPAASWLATQTCANNIFNLFQNNNALYLFENDNKIELRMGHDSFFSIETIDKINKENIDLVLSEIDDFVKHFQSSGTAENGNEVYNEVMDILYNIKNNN